MTNRLAVIFMLTVACFIGCGKDSDQPTGRDPDQINETNMGDELDQLEKEINAEATT